MLQTFEPCGTIPHLAIYCNKVRAHTGASNIMVLCICRIAMLRALASTGKTNDVNYSNIMQPDRGLNADKAPCQIVTVYGFALGWLKEN